MGSIQLGIQHAVGGLASKPERDLLMQDFMTVETITFASEGTNLTPAHHYSEFVFKTYAPIAFRYFRDLFGIQPDDFLISFCSAALRELSNPGASGSIFYLTDDDEFIIKTVQHKEGEFLQKLLPGYYMNLNQNPRTLLPKFFGLYCYQCNSKNIRMVAMNNLLPSFITMHQKYDLKGSSYKRKASKSERQKKSPTYKDLDFIVHHAEGIFLEADTYTALIRTIQRDCRVLESFKIMDYSLLVGIHNLDQATREKTERRTASKLQTSINEPENMPSTSKGSISKATTPTTNLNRSRSINRQRLVAHSTAMESIQAESEPIDEEEDVPPGGIPARNAKGERLLLFIGIIDILQSYRLKKKLEHTWKSILHDGDTVSVHKPGFYAERFQSFMAKKVFKKIPSPLKHSPSKRKSISRIRTSDNDEGIASSGANKPDSPPSPSLPSSPPAVSTTSPPAISPPSYPSVLKDRGAGGPHTPGGAPVRVPPPVPPRGAQRKSQEAIVRVPSGSLRHPKFPRLSPTFSLGLPDSPSYSVYGRTSVSPDSQSSDLDGTRLSSYRQIPSEVRLRRPKFPRLSPTFSIGLPDSPSYSVYGRPFVSPDSQSSDLDGTRLSSYRQIPSEVRLRRPKFPRLSPTFSIGLPDSPSYSVYGRPFVSPDSQSSDLDGTRLSSYRQRGFPSCSTPPPAFEEAVREFTVETAGSNPGAATPLRQRLGPQQVKNYREDNVRFTASTSNHVIIYEEDSVSISEIRLESRSENKSSLSVESGSSTSGIGSVVTSTGRHLTWTPPASVEGSTPTWTEGTPSFTESSSSGDIGCPTTPVRGLLRDSKTNDCTANCTEVR